MSKYRMFSSLQECYENSADDIAPFVKEMIQTIENGDEDDKSRIYGLCQAVLFDELTKERVNVLTKSKEYRFENSYGVFLAARGIEKYSAEDKQICNSIMHVLHTEEPKMREFGTEEYLRLRKALDMPVEYEYAYLSCEEWGLVGGDFVPDILEEIIRNTVSDLEVSLEVGVDWQNSHLNWGDYYDYSIPEAIQVRIGSGQPEVLAEAVSRLGRLELPPPSHEEYIEETDTNKNFFKEKDVSAGMEQKKYGEILTSDEIYEAVKTGKQAVTIFADQGYSAALKYLVESELSQDKLTAALTAVENEFIIGEPGLGSAYLDKTKDLMDIVSEKPVTEHNQNFNFRFYLDEDEVYDETVDCLYESIDAEEIGNFRDFLSREPDSMTMEIVEATLDFGEGWTVRAAENVAEERSDIYREMKENGHTSEELSQCIGGVMNGLTDSQIRAYMEPDIVFYEKAIVRYAMQNNLVSEEDVRKCLDPEMNRYQTSEIVGGMQDGLTGDQIELYADKKLNHSQMHVIRNGLCNGLDKDRMSAFVKPEISEMVMSEIFYAMGNDYSDELCQMLEDLGEKEGATWLDVSNFRRGIDDMCSSDLEKALKGAENVSKIMKQFQREDGLQKEKGLEIRGKE